MVVERMNEAKRAKNALIKLNVCYLGRAIAKGDEEYAEAFNAIMRVLDRLEGEE